MPEVAQAGQDRLGIGTAGLRWIANAVHPSTPLVVPGIPGTEGIARNLPPISQLKKRAWRLQDSSRQYLPGVVLCCGMLRSRGAFWVSVTGTRAMLMLERRS